MKKKKAFIIGVTGQDGSYMSKFLLDKNYSVFGFTRSLKKNNLKNLKILGVEKKINLKKYNDNNSNAILKDIMKYKPQEIYFFSGQSSVNFSIYCYYMILMNLPAVITLWMPTSVWMPSKNKNW